MLVVGFVCVFYNIVVDAKGEGYFSGGVGEEAGCVSTWYVPIGFQVLFQSFVCDAPGLLQSVPQDIRKGMYGLKQAGRIANDRL